MTHTTLKQLLVERLRRSGPITFERYMALCLYHPEFGYYTRGQERTGVAGDYFTSSDLHPWQDDHAGECGYPQSACHGHAIRDVE